jgi:transposase
LLLAWSHCCRAWWYESAKLNGLDPRAWLSDVIDRMANGHPINRLSELLPWNWQPKIAALAG